ncbi:hypothetical protein ACWD50_27265, partial [Micromonospora sp. NPDC005113]
WSRSLAVVTTRRRREELTTSVHGHHRHRLDALGRGDAGHLGEAGVYAVDEPVERGRLGMCGLLDTYPAAI